MRTESFAVLFWAIGIVNIRPLVEEYISDVFIKHECVTIMHLETTLAMFRGVCLKSTSIVRYSIFQMYIFSSKDDIRNNNIKNAGYIYFDFVFFDSFDAKF